MGVGLVLWSLRTTTTPIQQADAASGFQGEAGSDPGAPGVYAYATSGYEEIDAFGGARHDYPDVSYATLTPISCGYSFRWQPLQERWIEFEHCGPDGAVTRTIEYHEWFGIPDSEVEECAVPRSITDASTGVVCVADASVETYDVEVIGSETLVVGGESVATVHLMRTSRLSDGSTGETSAEVWRMTGSPLIVRMILDSSSVTSSPIGEVRYTEHIEIELQHVLPAG